MNTQSAGGGSYARAWIRYRWWSRAFWAAFFLYVPGISLIHRAIGGRDSGAVAAIAILWLIGFAVVGYFKTNFACPRCGELFFKRFDGRVWRQSWIDRPWARQCLHCGLAKWAITSPAEDR